MTKRLLKIMLLERIIKSIENDQSISYGELAFLQNNQKFIKKNYPDNLTLCEWAGIEEND